MIRLVRVAMAVMALAIFIAACSGGSAGPSGVASLSSPSAAPGSSTAPQESIDPQEAMVEYAKCMREHGVDMADPQAGPGGGFAISISGDGADREAMQEAQEACQDLMPGPVGEPREITDEERDAILAFARCMREHGIDMPDPVFDGGRMTISRNAGSNGGGADGAIDPRDEEFQAAEEACRGELGEFAPAGGPGGRVEVKP